MRNAIRSVAAAATTALIAALALHVPAARASSTQESILEDNPKLLTDPAGTLATLRGLGIDRVRLKDAARWSPICQGSSSSTLAPCSLA